MGLNSCLNLEKAYSEVKTYVINSGFQDEIEWQAKLCFDNVTESTFLREGAWVILNSGMRESVIRKYFQDLSFCFLNGNLQKRLLKPRSFVMSLL